jgi:hypothetical protein
MLLKDLRLFAEGIPDVRVEETNAGAQRYRLPDI